MLICLVYRDWNHVEIIIVTYNSCCFTIIFNISGHQRRFRHRTCKVRQILLRGSNFGLRFFHVTSEEVILRIFTLWKNPSTPARIEPANLGFRSEYDNHWTTGVDSKECDPIVDDKDAPTGVLRVVPFEDPLQLKMLLAIVGWFDSLVRMTENVCIIWIYVGLYLGLRARQHLRWLAPVMKWWWMIMMAKWYPGTLWA